MEELFVLEMIRKNISDLEKAYPDSSYIFLFDQLIKQIHDQKNHKKEQHIKEQHKKELLLNYSDQIHDQKHYVEKSRPISINQYGFFINEDMNEHRVNVRYYSNDFEEVLNKYRSETNSILSIDRIQSIFNKEKDNLKHLSWRVDGYY